MAEAIQIPYCPRGLQAELHDNLKRFNVFNMHRRFGKTVFAVNQLIKDTITCTHPAARGAYIAPFRQQAKQIAWEYLKHYTSPIPGMKYNESELRADFRDGSRISIYGGDNPNALRGIYLDAVVLDEFAQMHPSLWNQVIRPALADREGKATFIGTPYGMSNEFYRMYELAGEHPDDWYRRTVTVEESGYVSEKELEVIRKQMSPEEFEQEFMCSWSAAIKGAYYAAQMHEAEDEGRITTVPYDENYPVHTSWDLGVKDATVVWYMQEVGSQVRAIRCEAFQGMKLADIVRQVGSHRYIFGEHIAPHDIGVRELGHGSRLKQARALGINFKVAPKLSVMSGVNQVRNLIPRMVFDREACRDGIEALKNYRTEYNEKRQVFSTAPLHDWASDYADSLRYFAVTKRGGGMQRELDYSNLDRAVI